MIWNDVGAWFGLGNSAGPGKAWWCGLIRDESGSRGSIALSLTREAGQGWIESWEAGCGVGGGGWTGRVDSGFYVLPGPAVLTLLLNFHHFFST